MLELEVGAADRIPRINRKKGDKIEHLCPNSRNRNIFELNLRATFGSLYIDDKRRPPRPAPETPPGQAETMARAELRALEEQAWVVLSQGGDSRAFWKLVDSYEARLLYFVRRFVADPERALDVMQSVWLTVFRRLHALRQPATFRAWLYQVAHDEVVRLARVEIRNRRDEAAAREIAAPQSPDDHFAVENAEIVHRGLAALSVEHREVLALRFLEDMRLDEIAQVTRCNIGTVKSRLHYAKQAMREEVERLSHG